MYDLIPGLATGTEMVLLFFILLALRVPVAFSLGLSAIYAMWQMGFGLDLVGDLIAAGITKFSLLAIPFFILAGTLLGTLGIAERMIRFFRVLIGSVPGGMGLVGTVVCLFWGAVSGSGPASVAAIGPMIIKGMEEDGYPRAYSAGLVCTGAALSIVIPPSIGLVIYGVIAETSISSLFLAAILPGIFMGVMMLLTLPFAKAKAKGTATAARLEELSPMPYAGNGYLRRLFLAFKDSFWGLMTPVVILGGIYSGMFTPTEAALVATVYALLVGGLAYGTLTLKGLYAALSNAAASSAMVMLVVAYASLFGWVVSVEDLVGSYSGALLGLSENEGVILFVIMVILLIAGMFMDAVTVMFICLPIFLPVARELEWNLVWFGVLAMVNLAIGLITPPVGINLYVAAHVARLPIERIAKGTLPFLLVCLVGLAVIAAFPALSLLGADSP
ncbi:C4-dicarboxylate ABC transporter permease [Rhodobacter sp. TJ_12]|uniref:TRAP transporter large permease n=1 Tax=Rhodobacter sp. TJ_12 TaxID=2029399 RepID=UPI001CBB0878|nr:TRAP transporter large permease [Rhodobacter sp. TJ_12]MBZ4021941.1 C4-dicarboxylate ABC transporter permease [Rhodobacter sp. TJ_12]